MASADGERGPSSFAWFCFVVGLWGGHFLPTQVCESRACSLTARRGWTFSDCSKVCCVASSAPTHSALPAPSLPARRQPAPCRVFVPSAAFARLPARLTLPFFHSQRLEASGRLAPGLWGGGRTAYLSARARLPRLLGLILAESCGVREVACATGSSSAEARPGIGRKRHIIESHQVGSKAESPGICKAAAKGFRTSSGGGREASRLATEPAPRHRWQRQQRAAGRHS